MCAARYWDIHSNIATTDVNPPHQIMHSVMSKVDVLGTLSCVSVVTVAEVNCDMQLKCSAFFHNGPSQQWTAMNYFTVYTGH